MRRNNFSRGFGKSTFECGTCGRQTRITHQPSDSTCCFECWELAGWQNSVWDNGMDDQTIAARDALIATIIKRGGDADAVRAEFPDLFPEGPK